MFCTRLLLRQNVIVYFKAMSLTLNLLIHKIRLLPTIDGILDSITYGKFNKITLTA